MKKILNKIISVYKQPLKVIWFIGTHNIFPMSDTLFLKVAYKCRLGKNLNLANPVLFNEKMQWLKLYNRKDEFTRMVDKYLVKDYISKKIGEEYIIPTIGIYDNFKQIDFEKLPNQFVIKCTHDSGGLVIVKDKTKLDIKAAKKKINKSLKRNYYYAGREWPYKNVKPRIIVEKYLQEENSEDLVDYKFMCFNGKAEFCFVCSDRRSKDGLAIDIFDKEWNKAQFKRHYRNSIKPKEKPKNYEKMIEIAEMLAKDIPFVRVDFYEIEDKIYFGELTFYPGAGFENFYPEIWDRKLGDMITLPSKD
jgi:hypothetical protein